MKRVAVLFLAASGLWAQGVPANHASGHILHSSDPNANGPRLEIQLPKASGCVDGPTFICTNQDWTQMFHVSASWIFSIDGKEYKLTGAQLAEAVKKAAEQAK